MQLSTRKLCGTAPADAFPGVLREVAERIGNVSTISMETATREPLADVLRQLADELSCFTAAQSGLRLRYSVKLELVQPE